METHPKTDAREEILRIENELGLTAAGMSRLIGITTDTYRKNKSEKDLTHTFNLNNYRNLVLSLAEYSRKQEERLLSLGLSEK